MYIPVIWHEADFQPLQGVKEVIESIENLVVTQLIERTQIDTLSLHCRQLKWGGGGGGRCLMDNHAL